MARPKEVTISYSIPRISRNTSYSVTASTEWNSKPRPFAVWWDSFHVYSISFAASK